MTKRKLYRYIGYNGIITSPILLEDAKHSVWYELRASGGKVLVNKDKQAYVITVPESEVELWTETDRA